MSEDEPITELTALQVAQFDQAWAGSTDLLHRLVDVYVDKWKQDRENGVPEAVTIVGASIFLDEQFSSEELASALASAIVFLAEDKLPYGGSQHG